MGKASVDQDDFKVRLCYGSPPAATAWSDAPSAACPSMIGTSRTGRRPVQSGPWLHSGWQKPWARTIHRCGSCHPAVAGWKSSRAHPIQRPLPNRPRQAAWQL